ncbi:mRNA cap methyltransferas-like protein [Cucurbitaria berberidis CBS 394.84]|uniref:mRNA cap guanine-N(7) methyltransferase n=1 Tax=Cucurbitaria berberidis CBS 394.84 TaxID=1168544 RepID=A0A9P4LDG4_9PLEO|nr:mRNA cap methyltransferas-like protein [Cucurbitaria berberidis CBS 394.84]KAF1850084.1 mRNA cap methyltransferas-like protein [Cucurbitaria berberidis CBS 394.84]
MAGSEQGRKRARSASRSPSRSRSPPRQRKRPGAGARLSAADREAARKRQLEREQEAERKAQHEAAQRGVHDVVKQHYNMVPERGREWRQTDSKIKGLRSFNNWVKSSIIQKFIGDERNLRILDIGCGKGGDLQKWQASRKVELYVGCDPADVSIKQAKDRYAQMQKKSRRIFHAEFYAKDCFGEWLGDIPIIKDVGIDPGAGPGNAMNQRWGGGGWDMVTMMFCMHYAFESEAKAKGMLRNVAGALKKGGRFIGCIPNSDVLTGKVLEYHKAKGTAPAASNGAADEEDDRPAFASDDEDDWDPEKSLDSPKPNESEHANGEKLDEGKEKEKEAEKDEQEDGEVEDEGFGWGNSIYRVKFPGKTPTDGVFRPPYGWKYSYFLEEAVEAPEYVVPWEAFRALAEDYNLELQYRKPFREVWDEQKDDPELGPLSERMGVRDRATGRLLTTEEELSAADFYHTFCFYKV